MRNIFFALGTIIILAIAWPILPFRPAGTVTVTGSSQSEVANQVATFNATVTITNADKTTAVNSVNTKMTALIAALKKFGIADNDIKTENVSISQTQPNTPNIQIYPAPPVPSGNPGIEASNSITVTLRDVSKASDLTDLLNNSGATNVYGPNFTTNSDTTATDADLLSKAIANAKSKAETIAKANNQSVGKMMNVQEEGSNSGIFPLAATKSSLSVGSPVQAGTTTESKSVTVTWELK